MENTLHHLDLLSYRFKALIRKKNKDQKDLSVAFQLFSFFFEKLSENESVAFSSLFSRIAFVGVKHKLPSTLIYDNHSFRRTINSTGESKLNIDTEISFCAYLLESNCHHIYNRSLGLKGDKPKSKIPDFDLRSEKFYRVIKGLIVRKPEAGKCFDFIDIDQPHIIAKAEMLNADFKKQLKILTKNIEIPININLIDVKISKEQVYSAQAFVIKPNFMVGVTSISECFQSKGSFPLKYLVGKLVPSEESVHMLIGNIVNFFLDELIHNPDLNYEDMLKNTFKLAPESFALLSDSELKSSLVKIKTHFFNLQKVVKNELKDAGITKEKAYLEPSFYSDEYGVSGRLDLYHYSEKGQQSDIVELKSGKLFKANSYGLNENHYIQTLLYDLIIESIYKGKVKSNNYILYSYLDKQRLRYAPRIRSKQYEALLIRNDILMIEYILTNFEDDKYDYLFKSLSKENIPAEFTFVRREASKLNQALSKLSQLEIKYYKTFVAFLSREYSISKTGEHGIYKSNGMASLWLDPINEKISQFTVLAYLKIIELEANSNIPTMKLTYSERSNRLSKFRVGDIVVVYPSAEAMQSVLNNQIFKCTILEIDNRYIRLRLRARQKNSDIFELYDYWNIESDVLDSSFQKQFHALYDFIQSDNSYRQKILGLIPPERESLNNKKVFQDVTEEQNNILNQAIASRDYYLMWGPPGTGKTSVMIKNLVSHYSRNTTANILLLAYTNRAVDEICESIDGVLDGKYIRIGSRYSSGKEYTCKLLNVLTEDLKSRAELLDLLNNNRVFVSTVSSFQSKRNFFKLKKFDLAIVDEASQLLEPMLIGLLSNFKKYILIGDHKQLPAVVSQTKKQNCNNGELERIGFEDCSMSLFERMFKNSMLNHWSWAYGKLSYQGRMHKEILEFVSKEFYDNSLKLLPGMSRLVDSSTLKYKNKLQQFLIEHRMIFINTELDADITTKSNIQEANSVVRLIKIWLEIYHHNNKTVDIDSLGVITPFRSQIARIKEVLHTSGLNDPLTVDTIERYQGGSRNQIIISLAVNQADLLDSITNISEEGIDRKLNVALTRAKEHIVIFGTKKVLEQNPSYNRLISYCTELDAKELDQ